MCRSVSGPVHIGQPPFSREDLVAALPEFIALYAEKPLANNHGGMRSAHMFATWFLARTLQPTVIVESGVFKGQGSWLLRQACPDAELHCIEPAPGQIVFRVPDATYHTEDWSTRSWDALPRETTLLFFDDHQNALARVRRAKELGFRHLIFEDNYPPQHGDCYSLKKAFAGAGFEPEPTSGMIGRITRALGSTRGRVPPNDDDAAFLRDSLDIYYEMPPILRPEQTRWSTPWDDRYPTPEPLAAEAPDGHRFLLDEAKDYTWLCYARIARIGS